jgi:hypothetical protein
MALLEDWFKYWGGGPAEEKPEEPQAPSEEKVEEGEIDDETMEEIIKALKEAAETLEQITKPVDAPQRLAEDRFGVEFTIPAGFRIPIQSNQEFTIDNEQAELATYVSGAEDGASCIVGAFQLPFLTAINTDPTKLLEFGANTLLDAWEVEDSPVKVTSVLTSEQLELEGFPAHQWRLQLDAGGEVMYTRMAVYLRGMHLCALLYTDFSSEALDAERAQSFFASLRLQ